MHHEIILCKRCKGYGLSWKRSQPSRWRGLHEGILLDENGNTAFPHSELIDCEECSGTGRHRIPIQV